MPVRHPLARPRDNAVSPVIAVILMVAITVVLAATVYVWVGSFGAENNAQPNNIALTSGGTVAADTKSYVIATASPGLTYDAMRVTLDGQTVAFYATDCDVAGGTPPAEGRWAACAGGNAKSADTLVVAGDEIRIHKSGLSSQTLRVVDTNSNSVMLSLRVR